MLEELALKHIDLIAIEKPSAYDIFKTFILDLRESNKI